MEFRSNDLQKADMYRVQESKDPELRSLHEHYMDTNPIYQQFDSIKKLYDAENCSGTEVNKRLFNLEMLFVKDRVGKNPALAETYATLMSQKAESFKNESPYLSVKYNAIKDSLL